MIRIVTNLFKNNIETTIDTFESIGHVRWCLTLNLFGTFCTERRTIEVSVFQLDAV